MYDFLLSEEARRLRADLIHAYEYPLILDAFYGPARSLGVPLVGTVYAMAVPSWLPRSAALIAGTEGLVAEARRVGQWATLIEPPVDLAHDDPAAVDGAAFRARHGIAEDEIVLGIVCRLNPDMKEEGVRRAIDATRQLEARHGPRFRLLVTGWGPSGEALSARAAEVNVALGRPAVVLTGALTDPRPAYAAADIALGMGGSALRSMAFAKPLIVLGVGGFSRPFERETASFFFDEGFYGIGSGAPDPLAAQIEALLDPARRQRVGEWAREVVRGRYGLEQAVDRLEAVFEEALGRSTRWLPAALHTTVQRSASELVPPDVRRRVSPAVRRALAWQAPS